MSLTAAELAQQAQEYFLRADAEGRELTTTERRDVKSLLAQAERASNMEARAGLETIGRQLGGGNMTTIPGAGFPIGDPAGSPIPGLTPGEVFTSSPGFKAVQAGQAGETWTTGLVEVSPSPRGYWQTKGTLGELSAIADATRGPIGGGALVSIPELVPGVVEKLFAPLTIEQLLLSNQTSSPTVRFVVEGTATSGAAGVPEGGTKPESTIGLTTTEAAVKKVATFLPISEELMEDAPAMQAFINARLSLFVQVETERQIFRGAGGNELTGLFSSSAPIYTGSTSDDRPTQSSKR